MTIDYALTDIFPAPPPPSAYDVASQMMDKVRNMLRGDSDARHWARARVAVALHTDQPVYEMLIELYDATAGDVYKPTPKAVQHWWEKDLV